MSDIFEGEANSPASTQTTGSVAELVGEGKKFATVEDLAKGKAEADVFIEQLKKEQAELRSDLDQRLSAQDLLDEIRKEREAQLHASSAPAEGNTTPSLGQDDIASLVNSTIEQRETQQTADQNILTVDSKMKDLYGDKAQEMMLTKAAASNISVDFLKDIAAKSPNAFFNVLGLSDQRPATPTMTQGSVDTTGLTPKTTNGNSWSDFEVMRRENPKMYWKPETQIRLLKAKQEQGESFGN
jgi:hypothetical protein|tara:strand:- start:378 stop:1100 length:723 start_codon:yes stop_codon:yes gene_type:complete